MTASPLRILIFALGGEGGGVLMNWIVTAARNAGLQVQATSVPGVAQRTGSTSYYIEIAKPEDRAVLSLMPMPGRVDVVVASELLEAARAMELGFVSDRLTTLIASTNRVYATAEKIDMTDGRYDAYRIKAAAEKMAKAAHLQDFDRIARENATFISATLFGAMDASGVLPWDREVSEAAIGGANASLAGFRAAAEAVGKEKPEAPQITETAIPAGLDHLPDAIRKVVALGRERVTDHQDAEYGALFLERVERILSAADREDHQSLAAVEEAARRLALWMAYEDIARVADLKTRPERFDGIRAEVKLEPGQVLKVTEYLKPRAEEVADMLPEGLGRPIMALSGFARWIPFVGQGVRLRSNGILGYWLLRATASMRRLRRRSLRYGREQAAIEEWIGLLIQVLPSSPAFAEALAALPRLRKGYSDTLARGLRAYDVVLAQIVRPAVASGATGEEATRLQKAITAALADDQHTALDAFLGGEETAQVPNLRHVAKAAVS